MFTFLAYGSDTLNNASVSSNRSTGQDGAGQITVNGGDQIFPDSYIIEFEVQNVDINGELDGTTGFVGIRVFASQAAYNAGNATYTYTPQEPGQVANIQNSLDGIGDTYVRFNANVLVSSDPGAPSFGNLFVAPGSNVGSSMPLTIDHHTDVDYNANGTIDTETVEDGNGFFNALDSAVVCFTAGTLIDTINGPRAIETLHSGDLVQSADNGFQPIAWIGSRSLGRFALTANPRFRPVLIPKGRLGASRDLFVSRQHAIQMGDSLVRAIDLVRQPGLGVRIANGVKPVTYFHMLFDSHQIVRSNNIWSESLYPGPMGLKMLTDPARRELLGLFPEFALQGPKQSDVERIYGQLARPILRLRSGQNLLRLAEK
ncbi:MAG: type I secretion protein [Rhodobacteraceae bacterium]|nr:MAG: type I secretion protein [Paracoccaceae bacterium]